ncbi:hypothetical protein MKY96_21455 [Paenibacillus sp. FSL R7-0302]|uniref:hypothetical protein n=1 Tax=Paenibacillus sp. FSL R7-0302 TaxID=2921681 RepID=UPI0030FA4FCC
MNVNLREGTTHVQKEAAAFLYMRKGSCGVFLFTEPLAGRRHVQANERRTKVDWALQIRNY